VLGSDARLLNKQRNRHTTLNANGAWHIRGNTHPGRHEASRPRAMLTRLGSIDAVAVLASRQHLAQACLGDGEQAGPAWRLDWLVEHNMLYF